MCLCISSCDTNLTQSSPVFSRCLLFLSQIESNINCIRIHKHTPKKKRLKFKDSSILFNCQRMCLYTFSTHNTVIYPLEQLNSTHGSVSIWKRILRKENQTNRHEEDAEYYCICEEIKKKNLFEKSVPLAYAYSV